MNFLAHAHLSFGEPELLVGNMIADAVKGKEMQRFNPAIQKGILLHRSIDAFTDHHELVKETRKVFYPLIRHYALVISDVIHDHFLGVHWKKFNTEDLDTFSKAAYGMLDRYEDIFPPRFAKVYPYMRSDNWFTMYATQAGIHRTIDRLSWRSKGFVWSKETIALFENEYVVLEKLFLEFYPQLVVHAKGFAER